MKRPTSSRSAAALVIAMFALVVCSGLAVTMIDRATSGVQMQSARERRDLTHFSAASAANWGARWCLINATSMPTFTAQNAPLQVPANLTDAFANASNQPNRTAPTFTLTGLRNNADGSRLYRLTAGVATGSPGDRNYATATQEILIKFTPAPPSIVEVPNLFTRALFADLGFTYSGSADTDAWSGNVGAYSEAIRINDYGSALVGSNGPLGTQGNGWDIYSNPKIQGNLGMSLPEYTWTAPTSYINPPALANPAAPWTGSITLLAGQTYYAPGGINGATITINVPNSLTQAAQAVCTIYLGGSFTSGPFTFTGTHADWARVIMYQKDFSATDASEDWNGNATAGVVNDPSRFVFITEYGKANPAASITMNGNANFGGVLFAPYCSFKLNGNFDFYGSLMVRSISQLNGSFGMHYDTRLAGMTLPVPNATAGVPTMSILGWRER